MSKFAGLKRYLWAVTGRKPARVYYANGGIGDELMLTAIAAAARAAGRPIDVIITYPDLWEGNTDPASFQTGVERWHYAAMRRWIKTEVVHLRYETSVRRHIAEQMADYTGTTLPANWRPILRTPAAAPRDPRLLVIQNSCKGARYASTTKDWAADRWLELSQRLAPDFRLVQIGTPADPPLPVAQDLRGKTTVKQAAELLASAGAFVGLEGGLQHVAAAVHTPSVIVYGGRSLPLQTGYAFNSNVTRTPPCAGCGLVTDCPHNMICMDIPVSEVETAVRRLLASTYA